MEDKIDFINKRDKSRVEDRSIFSSFPIKISYIKGDTVFMSDDSEESIFKLCLFNIEGINYEKNIKQDYSVTSNTCHTEVNLVNNDNENIPLHLPVLPGIKCKLFK